MVMLTMQVRLTEGLVHKAEELVNKGLYSNKSEVLRDALRRLVLAREIGSIPLKGNSVSQVRKARKHMTARAKELNSI